MNTFKENLDKKIVESLKSNDTIVLPVLRDIKSQIINEEKNNKNQELDESQTFKVLEKMAKARRQSIDLFTQGNRMDLVEKEASELTIIETYLPKKISADDVKGIILKIIADNSFSTKRDMGNVIKKFNEQYAGQSDGKTISDICKEVLV